MRLLILDGHPDDGRLTQRLVGAYAAALPAGVALERLALRDLAFDPDLHRGYAAPQPWERDLLRAAEALAAADHLALFFPLWWGAEPARLKGFLDRVLLPGFGFRYRAHSPMWDRLLAGRSADLVVTMDTPPWYLRLVWGDPVGRRWRHQILGFAGYAPIRIHRLGMVRRGGAARHLPAWEARLAAAARSAPALRRGPRRASDLSPEGFAAAMAQRRP